MVNQNKIFSFKIKRHAKNVFPRDVERTVGTIFQIFEASQYFRNSISQSTENMHNISKFHRVLTIGTTFQFKVSQSIKSRHNILVQSFKE